MLTEIKIKSLAAKPRRYSVFDRDGLYLEIMPTGSKFWRRKHIASGRTVKKTIGPWPTISLKTARELNEKARFERMTAVPESAPSPVLADVCERWQAKFLHVMSPRTAARFKIQFTKHIVPRIGAYRIGDLTAETVLKELLRPIEETGHNETALRVRAALSRVLRFAIAEGQLKADVTTALAGALTPHVVKHMPTITDKPKIGRLILDIRNYSGGPIVAAALRMLPYVFVRPGELRGAEWSEFDLDEALWRIPPERMKMRGAHIVPLSRQVIDLLNRLRHVTSGGRYLFPGRNLKTKPISDVAINAALRYLGYGREDICGHGFRAMASTLLHEMGYNTDWIERQLAHADKNSVRAAYNHAEWLPERRKMMQDWADFLDRLASEASLI